MGGEGVVGGLEKAGDAGVEAALIGDGARSAEAIGRLDNNVGKEDLCVLTDLGDGGSDNDGLRNGGNVVAGGGELGLEFWDPSKDLTLCKLEVLRRGGTVGGMGEPHTLKEDNCRERVTGFTMQGSSLVCLIICLSR